MKQKLFVSFLLLTAILCCLYSCVPVPMSQTEIDKHFADRKISASQGFYQVGKRSMHYAKTGNDSGPVVFFVHGSPGSLGDYIDFLSDTTLRQVSTLIAVDRPGFGQSNFGRAEPSLEAQAALIKPLVQQYKKDRPVILVGHSLGGPVIARMAMEYPELIDGLVFVAASVDPELEPGRWWRAPFITPFFHWLVPQSLRASNDELYALKPELKGMLPYWKNIKAKAIIIQGTQDSLVPPANAEFTKKNLSHTEVKIVYEEGMDHFVPWSHPHLIKHAVLELIEKLKAKGL